ncbi:MAG: hypothetical protein IJH94_05485 [Clostridia bacterium]|nr:hypothetical protein [Clostridia bacterium]
MSIFFYIGFTSGVHKNTTDNTGSATVMSIPSHIPTAEPQRYRVRLEDGELRLYHDEGGISRLISSEEISEGSYPTRDIAVLKDGVIFETTEAALTLMENFLS